MLSFSESSLSKTDTVRRITARLGYLRCAFVAERFDVLHLRHFFNRKRVAQPDVVPLYARLGLVSVKVPSLGRNLTTITLHERTVDVVGDRA